jgi:hypothetical protein
MKGDGVRPGMDFQSMRQKARGGALCGKQYEQDCCPQGPVPRPPMTQVRSTVRKTAINTNRSPYAG